MNAIVIGGGIIGLCSAYYLQKTGWKVSLIDKSNLSDNCSSGNLGMIVPSHFVPLAAPGIVAKGIRWMFDNKSPFYIKPSFNPDLISWALKFLKSATREHIERSATAVLNLNLLSKELYKGLAKEPGFDFALEEKGILMYYKTDQAAEEEIHLAEKAKNMGLDVAVFNKKEVQALEPHLELDVLGAVHYRCDAHLYPDQLILQLIENLKSKGVFFILNTEVNGLELKDKKIKKIISTTGDHEADLVIMAAGSWLPQLAKYAGVRLPLMPGKGYSFTLYEPQQKMNIPSILCEAKVAITPMKNYLRFGGTMEIAPVANKINRRRVEGIVASIPKYFSNMSIKIPEEKNIWFGFRPCTPDGLPYLGFSKKIHNLIIAGGHAMMGLSSGPASGKIVADLANGLRPEIDIQLFNPGRF